MSRRIIPVSAVAEYQCPGCMKGTQPDDCDSASLGETGCASHFAGTSQLGGGAFALGLPKGFCRFGPTDKRNIEVFASYEAMVELQPNLTSMFCVAVWKHLDAHGNTVIRWFSPRTNYGWSTVTLGDCRDRFPGAFEITEQHLELMD